MVLRSTWVTFTVVLLNAVIPATLRRFHPCDSWQGVTKRPGSHPILCTKVAMILNFNEGITNCSDELNNKLAGHKYLLENIGYMFRPVNRSSSYVHNYKNIGVPISKQHLRLIPLEAS